MKKNQKSHRDHDDGFKLLGIVLSVVFLVFIGACGIRSTTCKAALHASESFHHKEDNDEKLSETIDKPRAATKR